MGEIIKFPGSGSEEVNLVDQLWDDRGAVPFPQWEARVKDLIAKQNPVIDAALAHTGANLFSHPGVTPEYTRDLMLWMARHPDFEIRHRADKHLSQFGIKIPEAYLQQIKEAVQNGPDQEVKKLEAQYHNEVQETMTAGLKAA